MNLAEKVKKRRIELGLSQDELAKKMGYTSRSSINKIEKGRPVSQKIVRSLAEALDMSFADLMGIEAQAQPVRANDVPLLGTTQRVDTAMVADFCLYATDDAMRWAHIEKNDLVFFVTRPRYPSGSIVAIRHHGDILIRRYHRYGDLLVFRVQTDYEQELAVHADDVEFLGLAIALQRKL